MESNKTVNISTILFSSSEEFLDYTRKINIISILAIILVGLAGHGVTFFVYSQKRFRLNSGSVYMPYRAFLR